MAVPVARRRHRVHGEDLVTGADERRNEQAPIGLDTDDYLGWSFDLVTDELVEAGDPLHPLGEPATPNAFAGLVLDVHVVMGLSPVHPYKYHLAPYLVERHITEPE